MIDHCLVRLIAQFKDKAAKACDRAEADRAFFDLLNATAVKRAVADHAALEKEARFGLEAEEPEELRPQLFKRVTEVRGDYADIIVASVEHVPPPDREIYRIAALMAHEKEFDRLLRSGQGGER